jgi:hypothetical protein
MISRAPIERFQLRRRQSARTTDKRVGVDTAMRNAGLMLRLFVVCDSAERLLAPGHVAADTLLASAKLGRL